MKILDSNLKLILASSQQQQKTYLLNNPDLTIISSCQGYYRIGSLQYSTGIAALGTSSQVRFHDFKYQKKLSQIQTILILLKLKILKNLLFCISSQRILIYNIHTNQKIYHIPTINGNLVTISSSYNNLKLLYPVTNTLSTYYQLQIWKNKTQKIQCDTSFSIIQYDRFGDILCFCQRNSNVVALYQGDGMVKGCSVQGRILWVFVSGGQRGKFYIKVLQQAQPKQSQKQKLQQHQQQSNKQKVQQASKQFYISLSLTNKQYLKLSQNPKQTTLYTENQLYFEHNNTLMIWYKNKVYATQVDKQPIINNKYRDRYRYNNNNSKSVVNNVNVNSNDGVDMNINIRNDIVVDADRLMLCGFTGGNTENTNTNNQINNNNTSIDKDKNINQNIQKIQKPTNNTNNNNSNIIQIKILKTQLQQQSQSYQNLQTKQQQIMQQLQKQQLEVEAKVLQLKQEQNQNRNANQKQKQKQKQDGQKKVGYIKQNQFKQCEKQ